MKRLTPVIEVIEEKCVNCHACIAACPHGARVGLDDTQEFLEDARGDQRMVAVVADEVRKLAERSNQAAREIAALIKESTTRVEEGASRGEEAGDSLRMILEGVKGTAAEIGEIATVSAQAGQLRMIVSRFKPR